MVVGAEATLVLGPGADPAAATTAAQAAIRGFLHPVTGGPSGRGWPFGRAVHRSEVLQLLDQVPGVDHVHGLVLSCEPHPGSCGDITIGRTQLALAGLDPAHHAAGRERVVTGRPAGGREQRLEAVPGGWLLARDLRDTPRLASVRLAQHQIAAHRSWGCAAGLEVTAVRDGLTVSPGAVIDRCGRIGVRPRPSAARWRAGRVRSASSSRSAVMDRPRGSGSGREGDCGHSMCRSRRWIREQRVHSGDGDRQWLRRPGRARWFTGTVRRGDPVTGTALTWTAHADLSGHRLDDAPAVVVMPAGLPAGAAITLTTVEVSTLGPDGFDLVVRHHIPAGATAADSSPIASAPLGLSWIALLSAPRPVFSPQEQS